MTRSLPSLDAYDMQGVRLDEAALWGEDVRGDVDDLAETLVDLDELLQ
ncbi:hypothetical protein [Streptomyces sp. NBC_00239]|nr:hypothetical protein [Streptomyces sp. NBC_00239]